MIPNVNVSDDQGIGNDVYDGRKGTVESDVAAVPDLGTLRPVP